MARLFLWKGALMDIAKFLPPDEMGAEKGSVCMDPEMSKLFPVVHHFLTDCGVVDGKPGVPGSLTIFADQFGWKIRLADRNRGWDLWAGSNTFGGCLEALEAAFHLTPVPWRKARAFGGGRVQQKRT